MSDDRLCVRCPGRRRDWDDDDAPASTAEFDRRCAYCGIDIPLCGGCLADTFLCERCFRDVRSFGKEEARRRGRRRDRQRKPWGRRRDAPAPAQLELF